MKKRLTLALAATLSLIAPNAIAAYIKPTPIACYFFKGKKLTIKNTCIYEGGSWAGGGGGSLIWEDGVKTAYSFGLVGRGEPACPSNKSHAKIDTVCGLRYYRHPQTLKRLSQAESDRLIGKLNLLPCIQIKNKSICWRRG